VHVFSSLEGVHQETSTRLPCPRASSRGHTCAGDTVPGNVPDAAAHFRPAPSCEFSAENSMTETEKPQESSIFISSATEKQPLQPGARKI
jgi:hypothetical protein